MIDEKKLLEDMKRKCCGVCKKCDYQTFLSHDEHCGLVDEQPKIGEWIPCSEKLPKDLENVLTCDAIGNIHVMWHYHEYKFPFGIDPKNSRYYPVIAWMPLPEPYKQKEVESES